LPLGLLSLLGDRLLGDGLLGLLRFLGLDFFIRFLGGLVLGGLILLGGRILGESLLGLILRLLSRRLVVGDRWGFVLRLPRLRRLVRVRTRGRGV
jgi:hypothetical protein